MLEQDAMQEAMSQFLAPVIDQIQQQQGGSGGGPIPQMPPTSIPNPAQYGQGRLAAGYGGQPSGPVPPGYTPMRDPFQPPSGAPQPGQQTPQGPYSQPPMLGQGMTSPAEMRVSGSSLFNQGPQYDANGMPAGATSDPRSPLGFTFADDQQGARQAYSQHQGNLAARLAGQQYLQQSQANDLRDRLKVIEAVSKLPADQASAILKAIGLNVPPGKSKAQEAVDEKMRLQQQAFDLAAPGKAHDRAITAADKLSLVENRNAVLDNTKNYQAQLTALAKSTQQQKIYAELPKAIAALEALRFRGKEADPQRKVISELILKMKKDLELPDDTTPAAGGVQSPSVQAPKAGVRAPRVTRID